MRKWLWVLCLLVAQRATAQTAWSLRSAHVTHGEQLGPDARGPSLVESMEDVMARAADAAQTTSGQAEGAPRRGQWMIPPRGATYLGRRGDRYLINKWGDTRMGIGFGRRVDVDGAFIAGQAHPGIWPQAVRVIGYRDGQPVGRVAVCEHIVQEPQWLSMNLRAVDRIVLEAIPQPGKPSAWYALDDLAFRVYSDKNDPERRSIVLTFDELAPRTVLSGSTYGGLTWEEGGGVSEEAHALPAPARLPGSNRAAGGLEPVDHAPAGGGTPPAVRTAFQSVVRGDASSVSFPPDTCGAIGPDHFVVAVNRVFAVYDRFDGALLASVQLRAFLPGSNGDPRVIFDQYSDRWIVLATDFSARILIAVSLTDDPMGAWFKSSILAAAEDDAECFPDYQTLGVDERGIYTAAYMASECGMTVFAIDKAPLLEPTPSLGTITAFRGLPFEGAIHPAHSFGATSLEYLVSVQHAMSLRLRAILPPLTAPALVDVGSLPIAITGIPPDVPALGSGTPLDTVGNRLMSAVYRNGSIWTTHTVPHAGQAAVRWYEIEPTSQTIAQGGTISDPGRHYYFPSIMVNEIGDAVLGFSGSSAGEYVGAFAAGRLAQDPPGAMSPPVLLRAGSGAQNNIDAFGRNRWGDYSHTSLDPTDETTIWTIQEYAHAPNVWGTWIAALAYTDCNANLIEDSVDIAGGTSADCDGDLRPDECELLGRDCDDDGVPDNCEILGDADGDGAVGVNDFTLFDTCLLGVAVGAVHPCICTFDFDANQSVDLADFAAFQGAIDTGP